MFLNPTQLYDNIQPVKVNRYFVFLRLWDNGFGGKDAIMSGGFPGQGG